MGWTRASEGGQGREPAKSTFYLTGRRPRNTRRRQLHTTEELVLSSGQPHGWLKIAADKYSATVRILDSKILSPDVVQHLFDINVKPELADQLIAEIRRDKDILDMEAAQSRCGRIHGYISTGRCTLCKEVAASRCFLASVAIEKGGARWTILGSHSSSAELLNSLEKRAIPFELKLKRNLDDSELLTARQEHILYMAFEKGYFDFPKKTGLKELAAETGVKTSTLTEILRRGQKKILEEYFSARGLQHPHSESGH